MPVWEKVVLYGILIAVLCVGVDELHKYDARVDAAVKLTATAKASQATVDKQVTVTDTQATENLKKQNTVLQAQLAAAKTVAQQVALINKEDGTHLAVQTPVSLDTTETQPPKPENPSTPMVVIPSSELPDIAKQAIDFKEAENQIAANQIILTEDKAQIEARDNTIKDQSAEITTLKGGSKLKRFLTATKHVLIGVGIGIAVDRIIQK